MHGWGDGGCIKVLREEKSARVEEVCYTRFLESGINENCYAMTSLVLLRYANSGGYENKTDWR